MTALSTTLAWAALIMPLAVAVKATRALDKVPYVPGAVLTDTDLPVGGFTPGNPNRQHLSLVLVPGATSPTGVHLFAHGSGGTVDDVGGADLESILNSGYALLSWESVTSLNGNDEYTPAEYGATCRDDLKLVLAWLVGHAGKYGLDLNDVNFGGRSRGSFCSWDAAHADHLGLNVSGIYMYNALPMANQPDATFDLIGKKPVTVDSPPAYLTYGPACPKPIDVDGCVPTPDPDNNHNPRFGQKIVNRYEELGIGDRITLTDGLEEANEKVYSYFESFVKSLKGELVPSPTALPPAPTTEIVCSDNDRGIIALAETVGVTLLGCTDTRVTQRCSQFQQIRDLCCVSCAGITPISSLSSNPFADGGDDTGSCATWPQNHMIQALAGTVLITVAALACM